MEIIRIPVERDRVRLCRIPNGSLFEYCDSLGNNNVAIVRGGGEYALPAKGFHEEVKGTIHTYCLTTKKDIEFDWQTLIVPLIGKLEVSLRN